LDFLLFDSWRLTQKIGVDAEIPDQCSARRAAFSSHLNSPRFPVGPQNVSLDGPVFGVQGPHPFDINSQLVILITFT
jgi:hypothetical protein